MMSCLQTKLAPDKLDDDSVSTSSSTKEGKNRKRPIFYWDCDDVRKWMRKYCANVATAYGDTFKEQAINGRALLRLTDWKLQMMGIDTPQHREELMRHIMLLKLRTEAAELKSMQDKSLHGEKTFIPLAESK